MTRRTNAVVTNGSAGSETTAVSGDVASALDVESGDPVSIWSETGERVTALVERDSTLPPGSIRPGSAVASQCSIEDDDQVIVARIAPSVARNVTVAPVPGLSIRSGESAVRDAIGDAPITTGEELRVSFFEGSLTVPVRVVETAPTGPVTVDSGTEIRLETGPAAAVGGGSVTPIDGARVGGYEETIEELQSAVVRPLAGTDVSDELDATGRAGVLLSGTAGVGKTHLLRHAAWLATATVHAVDAAALVEGGVSTAREELASARTAVAGDGAAIVHVEALDSILGDGRSGTAIAFREWLREFVDRENALVVGEARSPEALPEAFFGGDLFSRRVGVPRPDTADRAAILSTTTRGLPVAPSVDVAAFARRAFGYVAGDLLALCSRAVDAAVDRVESEGGEARLQGADFETALAETTPSAVPAEDTGVPDTSFDDIGGLEEPRRELLRAVEWPLYHGEWFEEVGIDPPSGVLLYGPPGTGKTMLARAVASTTDANFLSVNGPELMNKYVGESERAVRTLFEQARASAPTVVFFDEIDGLGSTRSTESESSAPERVVSQLLTEMDGLEGSRDVTVIGATNRPERLDSALLRPGRFDKIVPVSLPDREERRAIFAVHTRDRPIDDLDLDDLARRTDGYTGSDIAAVIREAGMLALEARIDRDGGPRGDGQKPPEGIRIRQRHVERALDVVSPSVSDEEREYYEKLEDRLDHSKDRS